MQTSDISAGNQLLSAIPEELLKQFSRHLEFIPMPLGKTLYEPGAHQTHVYFPTDSVISLLYLTEDGHSTEVSSVGREGMVGIHLLMSGDAMRNRAQVRSAGSAWRLHAHLLKEGVRADASLRNLLLRYTQARFTQTALTAVCNRLHSIDQQLCRSLLLTLDSVPGNELKMTQELLAGTLGVRREGVNEAVGKLQSAGIIKWTRGCLSVMSRSALEARCCECYQVVKTEFNRLLPAAPLARAA